MIGILSASQAILSFFQVPDRKKTGKVWFKLRQTDHYPPAEDIILLGDGDDS